MTEQKAWWQSKAIWGGIVAMVAAGLRLAGIEIDPALEAETLDLVLTLLSAIGGLIAVYGRVVAKSTIR